MPISKIEAELSKATKVKHRDGQDRQVFLKAMCIGVEKLDEDVWDSLSDAAQAWYNAAVKTMNAKKPFKDFADVGAVKPGADDDADEDEAPKKKGKKAAAVADEDEDEEEEADEEEEEEEEDEKPAKKNGKKAKPAADEDEDEDEEEEAPKSKKGKAKAAPADEEEEDEEEEDEAPAKKKGAKKKASKAADDEDEDEDEEDEAPKKKPAKKAAAPEKAGKPAAQGGGVKNRIKECVAADTDVTVDDIVKKLGKLGGEISKVTVTNVRAEFRHTLKFLKDRGNLKGIAI